MGGEQAINPDILYQCLNVVSQLVDISIEKMEMEVIVDRRMGIQKTEYRHVLLKNTRNGTT